MKTLYLPLKAKWYEMIERGEKKEEYREIKPYYVDRLLNIKLDFNYDYQLYEDCISMLQTEKDRQYCLDFMCATFKKFDAVRFSYGYTRRTMTFEIESIGIGKGKPEWGAPEEDVFIIKLGKRI